MRKTLGLCTALVLCVALLASTAQAGKSKSNVTNLSFATYVWQPTTVKAMNNIVSSWNSSHPNIQVHIVPVDVNSVHDKLLTSFVGGAAADIVHDEAADIAGFTQQG
jgi:multiple sugar transport system substrate-binding protein